MTMKMKKNINESCNNWKSKVVDKKTKYIMHPDNSRISSTTTLNLSKTLFEWFSNRSSRVSSWISWIWYSVKTVNRAHSGLKCFDLRSLEISIMTYLTSKRVTCHKDTCCTLFSITGGFNLNKMTILKYSLQLRSTRHSWAFLYNLTVKYTSLKVFQLRSWLRSIHNASKQNNSI